MGISRPPTVDWTLVRDFTATLDLPIGLPLPGTAEWCAAERDDKIFSLIVAGNRWALEENITQIHRRRAAEKDAAIEVSQSLLWGKVGRRIAERDKFLAENADWADRRKAAS
ncbi:DUF2742 domain-containing protein [Gordonia sp. Z-3]|uniref:DUF2742 domain-containing protein n=1 Tax=Gordonia sp. Z-3 TaxID=3115408 RepID=UPI002E2D847D|nr:DUF2742 domain-containing protein [Gordonia sp. Z-3]MED5802942.1 DUF2742 domain-containing protein [Gordonia sp. Z-3]